MRHILEMVILGWAGKRAPTWPAGGGGPPTFIPPWLALYTILGSTSPSHQQRAPSGLVMVYLVQAPRRPHGYDHSLGTDRHSAEPRCLPDLAFRFCGRCVRHVQSNLPLARREWVLANGVVRVGSPLCAKSLPLPLGTRARARPSHVGNRYYGAGGRTESTP